MILILALRAMLDGALRNLGQGKVSLPMAEG